MEIYTRIIYLVRGVEEGDVTEITMCPASPLKHPHGGRSRAQLRFLLLLILLWASRTSAGNLEMANYTETRSSTQLQKVVVVPGSGDVIVGARNWVLCLDGDDLELRQSARTGPGNETGDDGDNDASVLLGVPGQSAFPLVLYCGTTRHGLCTVYSARNLDDRKLLAADNTLNALGNRKSAVAFFGKGNLDFVGREKHVVTPGRALYVGVSYDGRPMEYTSKAVSARVLTRTASQTYNISYVLDKPRFNQTSATDIVASLKTSYLVDYIYGFEHHGFSYFLTVQKHLPYDDNGYVTHLVRVCQDDLQFNSYTEIQLYCRKVEYQATHYDIARAAHLSAAGEQLRSKYGFDPGEQVLYVAFGWARRGSGGSRASPENGSSVCMYTMSKVRKAFTRAQTDCYLGRSEWPSWIVTGGDHAKCNSVTDIHPINDDFCGRPENKATQGRYPLETVANITTRTLVTAIKVITYGSKTVAVLGTHTGLVHKVTIDGSNEPPFATIDVASGLAPRDAMVTDMALSADRKQAYVLTGNKVTKVPIQSCRVHTDCGGCVMADDPLGCGWCVDRCTTVEECTGSWHNKSCPPVIHSFSPGSGPVEGGTHVEIVGDNFGTKKMPSRYPAVLVALSKCNVTFFNWTHISCITEGRTHFSSDIEVKVSDLTSLPAVSGTARSAPAIYEYMSAYLSSFKPRFGPQSGGTILTLTGTHLNIGSSRTVSVAHLPCKIRSVTSTTIECETAPWQSEFADRFGGHQRRKRAPKTKGEVRVNVDNAQLTLAQPEFVYAKDPIIISVFPQESILSGGMKVTVRGENLNTVVHPRMMAKVVGRNGTFYKGDCEVHKAGEVMTCITPALPGNKPLSVDVYFLMDGVEELRNFPNTHPGLSRFRYFVNPSFTEFDNGLRIFYLDQVVLPIWGNNMDLVAQTDVISVMVGSKPCNVSQVGTALLLCNPERPLEGKEADLSQRYPVTVTMGNLHAEIGDLQFAEPSTSPMIKYLVPSCAALVVVFVLIIFVYYKRRVLRRRWFKLKTIPGEPNVHYASQGAHPDSAVQRGERREGTEESRTVNENSYWPSRGGRRMHPTSPPTTVTPDPVIDDEARRLIDDANLLISRDHLLLLEVIGQGHFGCVYRGFMKLEGSKEEVEVAVKTLKSLTVGATHFHPSVDHAQSNSHSYTTSLECRKFLDEALRMREFDHPNILRLIGIALDKENMPLVVLPFMKHGDLLSYIRNEQNSPTVKQLMDFGIQIAEGMAYLATLKFVHRDLAARNCMLDDTMNVKVADFGLSRDIYERDYYSSDDPKAKLPVKWMAPESLEKGTYDTKTDVWSYGVVLWELMTRGVCPYPEVDNWDIIKFLKEGRRMPQPSYCPDALYSIMLQCWQAEPKLRLTFEELVHEVKGIILSMERAHEKVGLNVTYVNVPLAQPYLYPQSHDRGQQAQAVGGAYGGAAAAEAAAVVAAMVGATGISTVCNGNPRLYPQVPHVPNGTTHRLSYHGITAAANASSRSTLV